MTNSSQRQKTALSASGTPIIIQLLQGASPLPVRLLKGQAYMQTVLSLLTKLSLVAGRIAVFAPIALITVNSFGKLIMHIKEALLLSA